MYKEISEVLMPEYPGFVRVISIYQKEYVLARIEYNIEFSNEAGYIFEKKFKNMSSFNSFFEKKISGNIAFPKEITLEKSHLNLLKDLIENKIKYLDGFTSHSSLEDLKENYDYIVSNR